VSADMGMKCSERQSEQPTRATIQQFQVSVCMSSLRFLQMRKAIINQKLGNKILLSKYHFDHMVSKCMQHCIESGTENQEDKFNSIHFAFQ